MEVMFGSFMSGMVAPFIIGIFTRNNWPKAANQAVAFAVSTMGGVLLLMLQGQLNADSFSGFQLMGTIAIIMTVSDKFYRMFKGTIHGIEGGVEAALSVRTPSKTDVLKESAKVLVSDEIERQIDKQVSERITRIMGVKDTAPAMDGSGEGVDDYEPVAG